MPLRPHRIAFAYAYILLVVVVLAGGIYVVHNLIATYGAGSAAQVPVTTYEMSAPVHAMLDANKEGDYVSAQADYDAIIRSATSTADDRALAILNGAGLAFRTSNDEQFMLQHIPLFKSVVEDKNVSLALHVAAINALASAYCGSGRTWAVFQEIYKGDPYSTFLVPNDPDHSGRNMFLWSYQQMPTGDAAISLAKNFAGQAIIDKNNNRITEYNTDIESSKYYLAQADILEPQQKQLMGADYDSSFRYALYLYWRAYTVAILAHYEGEPYLSEYKQDYDKFTTLYENAPGIQYRYVGYAHLLYGYFLSWNSPAVGTNKDASHVQFSAAIALAKKDPYFDTDPLVRLIRNEEYLRVTKGIYQGPFSSAIAHAKSKSPKFAAFVQMLLATSTKTSS
ncbi:MAG: hypothetical protein JWM46_917 [Candidatus Kaiserbacteria bacterium]|nr:hypothetical protein [Candidatus Kaiserbacteria bacterium]